MRSMAERLTLLQETNVISLRTASVRDDGDMVTFRLRPADIQSILPTGKERFAPKDFECALQDFVWLYRHTRSELDELKLQREFPSVQQSIKPMLFKTPRPQFRLLWSDSGHSVALFINEEPWAFIEEDRHQGYSKGILKNGICNLWNQELFEKIFL